MRVHDQIHDNLVEGLHPVALEVLNESHKHSVPANSETHFKVVVVSGQFADKALVARHRAINQLLAAQLQAGVHALSIHAYTPDEWSKRGQAVPTSPPCLGGSKAEAK